MIDSVHFEITLRCNMNCPYCYNESTEEGELTKDELDIIANKLSVIKRICVTGGEPFTARENLLYFLGKLKRTENQEVTLNTNLISVTKEDIQRLKGTDVRKVMGSLHSQDPNSKNYKKAISNLQALIQEGFQTAISMVVTKQNYKQVYPVGKMLAELGIKHFKATPFGLNQRNYQQQLPIFPEKDLIISTLNQLYQVEQETNIGTGILRPLPYCFLGDNTHLEKYFARSCEAGKGTFVVGPNGKVRPCIVLIEEYGSIIEEDLDDILKQMKTDFTREPLQPCHGCNLEDMCSGGCEGDVRAMTANNHTYKDLKPSQKYD